LSTHNTWPIHECVVQLEQTEPMDAILLLPCA